MRILLLGGSGFIGCRIVRHLSGVTGAELVAASRRPITQPGADALSLDALDPTALQGALHDVDAVVNCVTGNSATIINGAEALVTALQGLGRRPRLVHLSTMSVYGSQEGSVDESAMRIPDIGWYGTAKIRAEELLHPYAQDGGDLYILRPGCVYGPGSTLWTDRLGRLLRSGRLGDLGAGGDGWSNLVHVDDVASVAALCLLDAVPRDSRTFNLADPQSPRWNTYFRDLALAIGAVPLRYLPRYRMCMEGLLVAPPVKVAERVLARFRADTGCLPEAMPPSLLRLWGQQIRLDSSAVERAFDFQWTPYMAGLQQSAEYLESSARRDT